MTRRTGDWHLLGHGTDPVPASEYDVDRVAADYTRRGSRLREAHTALDRLSRLDGWRGEAAESFAETADDVLGDLDKAATRYEDAGRALTEYAGEVGTARTRSWSALQAAEDAEQRRRANAGDPLSGVAEPTPEQRTAATAQRTRHSNAVGDLADARRALDDALDDLGRAASACASAIRTASGRFKDRRFWDDVIGKYADQIDGLVEALKWVALGIAAVGLAIALFATAPIWGTIATVLLVVGAVVGAVILAGEFLLAAGGTGKATWTDVGMAVVGLVTLGFGQVATRTMSRAVPGLLAGATSRGQQAVRAAAHSRLPQNGRNALNIGDPTNPLRQWAQRSWDDLARPGLQALDEAGAAVPTARQVAQALDRDLATNLARIHALTRQQIPGAAADLAEALRLTQHAVRWNATDLVVNLDSALDKAGISPMSHLNEQVAQLHWRLTAAGR